jgi:hypothetical protein
LLLSDFIKSMHNISKRIDILGWLLDFQFNVLNFFSKLINIGLGFLEKIFSISIFPLDNPFLKTSFDIVSLQT